MSFSLYALEVAFPYLIFAAKNKTVSYVLVRREPTNAKQRKKRLKFSLGFVLLLAVPREDRYRVFYISQERKGRDEGCIEILVRDISLTNTKRSFFLSYTLSFSPLRRKKNTNEKGI